MIKVYALTTCPWCKKVKAFLTSEGVPFESVDVDVLTGQEQQDALAEVERLTGKTNFPVTIINEQVILGYKPEEIKGALGNEG